MVEQIICAAPAFSPRWSIPWTAPNIHLQYGTIPPDSVRHQGLEWFPHVAWMLIQNHMLRISWHFSRPNHTCCVRTPALAEASLSKEVDVRNTDVGLPTVARKQCVELNWIAKLHSLDHCSELVCKPPGFYWGDFVLLQSIAVKTNSAAMPRRCRLRHREGWERERASIRRIRFDLSQMQGKQRANDIQDM